MPAAPDSPAPPPANPAQPAAPPFDIALVMAGAVSAGAYTAGAVDFLLQALDAWYADKAANVPDCPPHDVRLRVMTGASAGAITAAIVGTVLGEELPPVTEYPHPSADAEPNKLFDAWVNQVDITGLLGHDDLDADPGPVRALLDSTVLDRIGDRVFRPGDPRAVPRPYVDDPVLMAVTLTNLRGVPYEIDFAGLSGPRMPYIMTLHADFMTFAVGRNGPVPPARLPPATLALDGPAGVGAKWKTLRDAALASGAFPIGLLPRALRRPSADYRNRFGKLAPAFGDPPDDFDYDFLNVDGGTMDNEPVGRARDLLGQTGEAGSTAPDAEAAILMIDPFPDDSTFDRKDEFHNSFTLLRLAPRILRSLISQARFKPEELTRAINPDVFNQFLIAPVRSLAPTDHARSGDDLAKRQAEVRKYPIASGGLGGFAGFLARDFRAHDFQLGRRNAQQFLRRHFVLPEKLSDGNPNPLFARWTEKAREKYRVRRDARGRTLHQDTGKVWGPDDQPVDPTPPLTDFLPIVPLADRVADEEPSPTWPTYPRDRLDDLREQITDRAKQVVERVISGIEGRTTQFFLRRAWWLKRADVVEEHLMAPVVNDLTQRGLLGP